MNDYNNYSNNDYIPIDIRKLKDKNRVSLSDDLIKLLGNPEIIVYSKLELDGDVKIVVNNARKKIIGKEIDAVKIDGKQRCTITKKVRDELGIDDKNSNNFVGFFITNAKDKKLVEIINISNLGKRVKENV